MADLQEAKAEALHLLLANPILSAAWRQEFQQALNQTLTNLVECDGTTGDSMHWEREIMRLQERAKYLRQMLETYDPVKLKAELELRNEEAR